MLQAVEGKLLRECAAAICQLRQRGRSADTAALIAAMRSAMRALMTAARRLISDEVRGRQRATMQQRRRPAAPATR